MVARDLKAHVLVHVPVEFVKILRWLLEILPWAFRCDVKSTERLGSPAVVACIPVVVGVLVCLMLIDVITLAIEHRIALECLGEVTSCVVLIGDLERKHDWRENEKCKNRRSNVLFGHLAHD